MRKVFRTGALGGMGVVLGTTLAGLSKEKGQSSRNSATDQSR